MHRLHGTISIICVGEKNSVNFLTRPMCKRARHIRLYCNILALFYLSAPESNYNCPISKLNLDALGG